MTMLDESKPFGRVRGSLPGVRYEQDGKLFNARKEQITADGKLVGKPADKAPEKPEAKAEAPRKPARRKAAKAEPEGVKPMSAIQAEEDSQ